MSEDRYPKLSKKVLGELYYVALYRIAMLESGHERCFTETDYCYCCDSHPSHGHDKDCPFFDA